MDAQPINEVEGTTVKGKNRSATSACDRCHGFKLRCDRKPSSGILVSCRRCEKAKIMCVTTPRRRTGRPRAVKSTRDDLRSISDGHVSVLVEEKEVMVSETATRKDSRKSDPVGGPVNYQGSKQKKINYSDILSEEESVENSLTELQLEIRAYEHLTQVQRPSTSFDQNYTLCMQKLSSLTSDLILNLNNISRTKLHSYAHMLDIESKTRLRNAFVVLDPTENEQDTIAGAFLSCQRFLEVFKELEALYSTPRSKAKLTDGSHASKDFKVMESPVLLMILACYSSMVRYCELLFSLIHKSLLAPNCTERAMETFHRVIEVDTLSRTLWRMLTHFELRLLIIGRSSGNESLFGYAMPELGRRKPESTRDKSDKSLGHVIEMIAKILHGLDIRMM
ncbi:hypothetical protein B0O99DRAFT_209706 [Bisporella sp. PMI_857]|nr:hypothetical protein B0O99DRAFT_209706 [Bisporella sp. PMI_857]